MADPLQRLEYEVARFRAWADTLSVAERSGEWECAYDGWRGLRGAFSGLVSKVSCRQWDAGTIEMLLYIIARDNEMGDLAEVAARNPGNLVCLAEHAVASSERDARWQLASVLGRQPAHRPEIESLLVRFTRDDDEYVRRRALMALADVGSPLATGLAEQAWKTGDEYQRMASLYALWKVGSPKVESYLALAETDGRQHLVGYAARVRAGDPG